MIETTADECSWCGQPLIEIAVNRAWIVYLCDTSGCWLYREKQGSRLRVFDPPPLPDPMPRKRPSEYPGFRAALARQGENYREARRLGATPAEAQAARTNKGFQRFLDEKVNHG